MDLISFYFVQYHIVMSIPSSFKVFASYLVILIAFGRKETKVIFGYSTCSASWRREAPDRCFLSKCFQVNMQEALGLCREVLCASNKSPSEQRCFFLQKHSEQTLIVSSKLIQLIQQEKSR